MQASGLRPFVAGLFDVQTMRPCEDRENSNVTTMNSHRRTFQVTCPR
jgi:hypothetical protein